MKFNKYTKSDYLESSLPKTRREQFFDLIKTNYSTYFKIGLILLLFSLPFLACVIFGPYFLQYIKSNLTNQGMSESDINKTLLLDSYIISILKIISVLIFAIPLAGVGRINREMTFSKGILFWKDFLLGIKQNIKRYLLVSFLMCLFVFLIEVIMNLLVDTSSNAGYVLGGIMFGIFFIIILPTNLMILVNSTIYTLKYSYSFLNCVRFVVKHLFICLAFMLFPALLYFLQLLNFIYIQATIYALAVLFILPIFAQAWHSYCVSRFDIYINKKNYPDIYLQGLNLVKEEGESHEK